MPKANKFKPLLKNVPSAAAIKQQREQAGLTLAQAAELVHQHVRYWTSCELGLNPMQLDTWELFLLKTLVNPSEVRQALDFDYRVLCCVTAWRFNEHLEDAIDLTAERFNLDTEEVRAIICRTDFNC